AAHPQGAAFGAAPARRRHRGAGRQAEVPQHRRRADRADGAGAGLGVRALASPCAGGAGRNARRLLVLGAVALVALGAALWSTQSRRAVQEGTVSQPLVPGLEQGLSDITEVRVRTPGDTLAATLRRSADGWVRAERGGWPADADKLREYLLK